MENNRQEEFDGLSFEQQMRIEAMRREHDLLMQNIDTVVQQIVHQVSVLNKLDSIEDADEMLAALFCAAEWADSLKSYPEGEEQGHEWAREFDWMRHVLRDRGISDVYGAIEAVREATTGNFQDARVFARGIDCDNDEFNDIIVFWTNNYSK